MRPTRLTRPPLARIVLLLVGVALATLVTSGPTGAQALGQVSGQAGSTRTANAGGRRIAYQYRTRGIGSSRSRNSAYRPMGDGKLTWHNGPVQHHPTQYLIFWGPAWESGSNTLVPAAQLVKQYVANMAATSFERVVTQYGDHSGRIANTDTLAAVVVDTAPPVTDRSCGEPTIQDTAIMQEVAHMGQTLSWPAPSVDATYLVYTPPHYAINDGEGHCSTTYFCAYHAWSTTTPGFAYAAIAYPDDAGCQVPRSPHHDLAGDSLASTSSHEQLEAITDPQVGTGWLDAASYELADKCATDYGLGYTTLANRSQFELQGEYSNASRSCVNSYTPPLHSGPRHSTPRHQRRR